MHLYLKHIKIRLNKIKLTNNNVYNDNNRKIGKKILILSYVNRMYDRVSCLFKNYQIDCIPETGKDSSQIIVKGKDKTRKNCDKNNVIYRVECEDCKVSQFGQTKRSFKIRKSEHLGRKSSVIYEHLQENKTHDFD